MRLEAQPSAESAPADAGFSLLEMLISITIVSLVLALLPGTFRLAHRTWDSAAALDHQARRDSSYAFLQSRLAEALPMFEQQRSGVSRLVFTGSAASVSFVSPSANGSQGAGLYRFTFEARPASQGRGALVAQIAPYVSGAQASSPEEHVLYQDVTAASFRYWGRKDMRSAPAWRSEWNRRDALPEAVELTISSGKALRTILVPLRLKSTL